MFISCKEANQICNKAQYGEASFIEKLKLKLHLIICKVCSLYSKQNTTITKICEIKAKEIKKAKTEMPEQQKEALKEKIKEHQV